MLAVGHVLEPRPTNAIEDDDEYEDDFPLSALTFPAISALLRR
jgi:hypothetical protein